jgi:hypothetical protein
VLTKETLVAAVFLPLGLALCVESDGILLRPRWSRRNVLLVTSSLFAVTAAALPVLWAIGQAGADGYARQFGSGDELLSNSIFGLLPAAIPFEPFSSPGWAATVALIAWVLVLVAGLGPTRSTSRSRQHKGILLALALGLLLARVLVYLPWPLQHPYYTIPYLLGTAIILSVSVTRLTQENGIARLMTMAGVGTVLLYSAIGSSAQASRYFASRHLSDDLVEALSSLSRERRIDSILVAVPALKERAWTGLGPTLERFGAATGRQLPRMVDSPCAAVRNRLSLVRPEEVTVSLRWQCDLRVEGRRTVSTVAVRLRPECACLTADTLRADIVAGGQVQ